MSATVGKVTAFVTRGADAGRELLVFAHPSAGIQVPAGTVEPGEGGEEAVLRETAEEAGLTAVRIVAHLDTLTTDLAAPEGIATRATPLFRIPALAAPHDDFVLGRGWPIAATGATENGWTHVTYEDLDANANPPRLLLRCAGWVPADCVGTRVVRELFHLTLTAPAANRWEHLAEDRYRFSFFWAPLAPRPQLVARQDDWLDRVYQRLIHATA